MENKWIRKISGNNEKIKLICVPYAGAGSIIYTPWIGNISEEIGLYTIMLPGREKRIREQLETNANKLCAEIIDGIKDDLNSDYILFGHSMGGMLVYEITKQIYEKGLPLPKKIIMSATSINGFDKIPNIEKYNDDELSKYLGEMGGTDNEILYNESFRECFFPIIRADYKLVREYVTEEVDLPVEIVAFAGKDDKYVELKNLYSLEKLTRDFSIHFFEGNHFFMENASEICPEINKIVLECL